jgi:hypothetical protein
MLVDIPSSHLPQRVPDDAFALAVIDKLDNHAIHAQSMEHDTLATVHLGAFGVIEPGVMIDSHFTIHGCSFLGLTDLV